MTMRGLIIRLFGLFYHGNDSIKYFVVFTSETGNNEVIIIEKA